MKLTNASGRVLLVLALVIENASAHLRGDDQPLGLPADWADASVARRLQPATQAQSLSMHFTHNATAAWSKSHIYCHFFHLCKHTEDLKVRFSLVQSDCSNNNNNNKVQNSLKQQQRTFGQLIHYKNDKYISRIKSYWKELPCCGVYGAPWQT